jgi:hypothetical protein
VFKKTEKPIKPRKPEKNNRKNRTVKKNRLNFWKNRPVRFRFFKPGTKKTELNPNRKNRAKPEKNLAKPEPNRFEPVFVLKNRTEPKLVGLNRFQFSFGFLKKKFSLVIFLIKIEPNRKWIPLIQIIIS